MLRPPFTSLAEVYDLIMADIEYDDWVAFILKLVAERGGAPASAVDLGCGTGNATFPLARRGLDVVGVDASPAMLAVARRKLAAEQQSATAPLQVRFVEGAFETFSLGRRFELAVSVFDAVNNLLTPAAFMRMARNVLRHLEPAGFFVFDVNTTVGLRDLWEQGRAEGWADEVYYRWLHTYDEESGLARVEAFCQLGDEAFTEVHYERPYDPAELRELLSEAGFAAIEVVEYPEGTPPEADAVRVWVVAQAPVPPR